MVVERRRAHIVTEQHGKSSKAGEWGTVTDELLKSRLNRKAEAHFSTMAFYTDKIQPLSHQRLELWKISSHVGLVSIFSGLYDLILWQMLQWLFADCSSANYPALLITVFDSVNCSRFITSLFKGAAWVQQELHIAYKWVVKQAQCFYNHWLKCFSINLISNTLVSSIQHPTAIFTFIFSYFLQLTHDLIAAKDISRVVANDVISYMIVFFTCLQLLLLKTLWPAVKMGPLSFFNQKQ